MAEISLLHFNSSKELTAYYGKALHSSRDLSEKERIYVLLPPYLSGLIQVKPFIGQEAIITGIAKGRNGSKPFTPLVVCQVGKIFFPVPANQLFSPADEVMELIKALPG